MRGFCPHGGNNVGKGDNETSKTLKNISLSESAEGKKEEKHTRGEGRMCVQQCENRGVYRLRNVLTLISFLEEYVESGKKIGVSWR